MLTHLSKQTSFTNLRRSFTELMRVNRCVVEAFVVHVTDSLFKYNVNCNGVRNLRGRSLGEFKVSECVIYACVLTFALNGKRRTSLLFCDENRSW